MGRKFSAVIIALISVVVLLPICASANSAEPPMYTIVCDNCPSDTVIFCECKVEDDVRWEETVKTTTAWESYFDIFSWNINWNEDFTSFNIKVVSAKKSFELKLTDADIYHSYYTLDFDKGCLRRGEKPLRTALLIVLRVVLTLIMEGIVFWFFKYRSRRSWTVFVVVNIITQGFLNFEISREGPPLAYYWFIAYILIEILVFATEMIAIPIAVNEQPKWKSVLCVFVANVASLVLGGLVIMLLPI